MIAALAILIAWVQWKLPLTYPWPFVALIGAYLVAGCWYTIGRLSFADAASRILPAALFIVSGALAFLLLEEPLALRALAIALALVPWLALSLLYFALYDPAKYPVNGLSRLNIALVPPIAFLLTVALNGLQVFLRLDPWVALVTLPVVTGALYLVTAHPTALATHRYRWAGLGAMAGFKAAVLCLLLPVAPPVQGAIAALLVALPLRVRRYSYAPALSRRQAMIETSAHAACYLLILLTSRWA